MADQSLTFVTRKDQYGSYRVWAVLNDGRVVSVPKSTVWPSWAAAIPVEPTMWRFAGFDSGKVERLETPVPPAVLARIGF